MMEFNHINFNRLFGLVKNIGPSCDAFKNRFDKADLIETGIEEYSEGIFRWVDEIGYDHVYSPTQEKLEVKSQKNVLYNKKGALNAATKPIKLMNTLGGSSGREFPCCFNKLMIIDTGSPLSFSVGIVDYEIIRRHVRNTGDGWDIQIPLSKVDLICKPQELDLRLLESKENNLVNYIDHKHQMQREFVRSIS